MVHDRLCSGLWMVVALGFLGACSGNVEVAAGGNGGEGGSNSAEGGGTTGTTSNTGAGNTGGTGGNTGGGNTGGNTGGTGGNTGGGNTGGNTGGTGGGTMTTGVYCGGFDLGSCLSAFPECVPVYDDQCCSTCYPGGCADCTNLYFHHCAPWQEMCEDGPAQDCGFAPEWACNGEEPDCTSAVSGVEPCAGETGCIPAYCPENADCPFAYVCHPAKSNMCEALCASVPPPCPEGMVPETDGACWTGLCIPQIVCY